MRCVVFVPQHASAAKVALIEAQGAELRHVGADVDEAKEAARAFAEERGAFFFEDGAETAQFEGYETIGHELLDAIPEPPGAVVVPVAWVCGDAAGPGQMTVKGENKTNIPANYLPYNCRAPSP